MLLVNNQSNPLYLYITLHTMRLIQNALHQTQNTMTERNKQQRGEKELDNINKTCSQTLQIMDILGCAAAPSGSFGALTESTQTGSRVGFSFLV